MKDGELLLRVEVRSEADVVMVHKRTRRATELLGFDKFEQARIATATSELVRNALLYARGGAIELLVTEEPASLLLRVSDQGPGITGLEQILAGAYRSRTGLGLGLSGVRRLMERFHIDTSAAGTTVLAGKSLPRRALPLTRERLARIRTELTGELTGDPFTEIRRLNQELLQREEALATLSRELEDTNRGVVALYAELDERAEYHRRATELKTRLLSDMGHEIRTPVHSVRSIAQFLMDRLDGDLNEEQDRQVRIIHHTASELADFVDDLLDIGRAEAGQIPVRPSVFSAVQLFNMLRGMLRPLARNTEVQLIFQEPAALPLLHTDEGKISQILRNFISNALKFTEAGEVRVSAAAGPEGFAIFTVRDTGIGIAPEDQERIFAEFTQVEGPLQNRFKGTGLGLPLTRRLAALLGGEVVVQSEVGVGSSFSLVVPRVYDGAAASSPAAAAPVHPVVRAVVQAPQAKALVIDDDEASRYVLRRFLEPRLQVLEARRGREGLQRARAERPAVIFLDLALPDLTGFEVLDLLQGDAETASLPVIIYTSQSLKEEDRRRLGKAVTILRKASIAQPQDRAVLEGALQQVGLSLSRDEERHG